MLDIPKTQQLGLAAEMNARAYLEARGLRFLENNYRCGKGEIDLIMRDKNEVVFVEVRARKNPYFMATADSVDFHKQKKIIATATHYLCHKKWFDKVNCRFDVIGISYAQTKADIEWIKDAFHADNF
jgi:putative endonuclease